MDLFKPFEAQHIHSCELMFLLVKVLYQFHSSKGIWPDNISLTNSDHITSILVGNVGQFSIDASDSLLSVSQRIPLEHRI